MKVLYVNHTSSVSGAERSLLDLLRALPPSVESHLACPRGELAAAATEAGVATSPIPEVRLAARLHPFYTPRGIAEAAVAGAAVRRLARSLRPDLVHANSVRAALVAAGVAPVPLVVHLRDCVGSGAATRAAVHLVDRRAAAVLANSEHTAATFRAPARRAPVRVVHNGVDLGRFDPAAASGARIRRELGARPDDLVLGVVGQLTPWKGQDDSIGILRRLRADLPNLHLIVAGAVKFAEATSYDNRSYERRLTVAAADDAVRGRVHFLGEREDVADVLAALDVLLVPSWEEPFGRVVLEGMAMRVPVVATNVGGPAEILTDGVDGFLLPPRQPGAWAALLAELLVDPARRERVAEAARRTVQSRFRLAAHAEAVADVYASLLGVAADGLRARAEATV